MKLTDILANAKAGVTASIKESGLNFEFDKDTLFEGVELDEVTLDAITESLSLYALKGVNEIADKITQAVVESLEADMEAYQEEVVKESKDKVLENVEYAVNQISTEWLKENEEAVSNRTKACLFESFMDGLTNVFVDHKVELDDSNVDVYDRMVNESKETAELANKLAGENKLLKEKNDTLVRNEIIKGLTEGMADTNKEKFESLVEGMATDKLLEKGTSLKAVFSPKEDKVTISGDMITEAKAHSQEKTKKPIKKTKDETKLIL